MLAREILQRVREIEVRTGRDVADVLSGEYVSAFKGRGVEFDEVRPYVPGDDVRTIDWNVTARTGEPHVKRYVEERQLTLMLMADISASQDFGSTSRSKRETTAELCALLAFSAARSDDNVGLTLFHGDVEQYIPPRKGQRHALRVVREVLAHGREHATPAAQGRGARRRGGLRLWRRRARTPRHTTDIGRALRFLLSGTKRRTICFVVSDFLDEGFERALAAANAKHDVVAVCITDPREVELPDVGLIALRDAETGRAQVYDTGSARFREQLQRDARERVSALRRRLASARIDCIEIQTGESVVDPLVRFFRMRERRVRR